MPAIIKLLVAVRVEKPRYDDVGCRKHNPRNGHGRTNGVLDHPVPIVSRLFYNPTGNQ